MDGFVKIWNTSCIDSSGSSGVVYRPQQVNVVARQREYTLLQSGGDWCKECK